MKELKFIRKTKSIFDAETKDLIQNFDSINKAKKFSHELQMANGGLGRGSLQLA